MHQLRLVILVATVALAQSSLFAGGFVESLTAEQRKGLGLDHLTPQQQADLDSAVENYRKSGEAAVAKVAAATAVAEYKKKEEPSVISRALEVFKSKEEEARQERITAVIKGRFSGWTGATLFSLDNGQVWRQNRSETYYTRPKENVAVVVYKGPGGVWRLRVLDDEGAWVTVKRLQ